MTREGVNITNHVGASRSNHIFRFHFFIDVDILLLALPLEITSGSGCNGIVLLLYSNNWFPLPGRSLVQRFLNFLLIHIILEVLQINLIRLEVLVDDIGSLSQVAFHLILILGELRKLVEQTLLSASLDINGQDRGDIVSLVHGSQLLNEGGLNHKGRHFGFCFQSSLPKLELFPQDLDISLFIDRFEDRKQIFGVKDDGLSGFNFFDSSLFQYLRDVKVWNISLPTRKFY